ncbi:neuromedin-B isoform X2 [Ascaphus truei]|uniref:neuromedin-B isoform X2 n=1 Tax=Ascaphus truei TaxID=8439 RepID=UPI003F590781
MPRGYPCQERNHLPPGNTTRSSAEFSEEASKQGKFNVLPRGGHQWAVGHFMGKKSLQESPRQSETELLSSVLFPPRSAEDVWGQFLQELRRASSLSQMDESQRVLRKILEQYIKSSRK